MSTENTTTGSPRGEESKRSIFRVAHDRENPYLQVSKEMLRDPELSLKAKGLLSFMLAKPDDWSTYLAKLASELKESRNCIARIVEELRAQGYCERTTIKEGNLIAGYDYAFHEVRIEAVAQTYREEKARKAAQKANPRTNPRKPHFGVHENRAHENGALLNTDCTEHRQEEEEPRAKAAQPVSEQVVARTPTSSSLSTPAATEPEGEALAGKLRTLAGAAGIALAVNKRTRDLAARLEAAGLLTREHVAAVAQECHGKGSHLVVALTEGIDAGKVQKAPSATCPGCGCTLMDGHCTNFRCERPERGITAPDGTHYPPVDEVMRRRGR